MDNKNYCTLTAPRSLIRAIKQLKARDDIIITKPDKGSGVVVMDKTDYLRLLSEASVNDSAKFRPVNPERPKTRGRPPKYYHPLLEKEKLLVSTIYRILPKKIADSVRPQGSRLAHLYGLPKTHKTPLSMRPILSATQTYNYALAKWLDDKLKPLSCNDYMIKDTFEFLDEIRSLTINQGEILVSFDVTSLFTNVPLDETIEILADKAFNHNWFNSAYDLNLKKCDLIELLRIATKDQLFQYNGMLYEQTDGVAMGSPLGPLLANVFMCSLEQSIKRDGLMPSYYRRYVDDTLTVMPDITTAANFLQTLNSRYSSINFTMEVENNGMIPFIGVQLLNRALRIETKVFVKPTNTGLLLHHQSHVDNRYKRALLQTMLDRAYRISSSWSYFTEECERLKSVFVKLKYPESLIDRVIHHFVQSTTNTDRSEPAPDSSNGPVRVVLPFKDQPSADRARKRLKELSHKTGTSIQPVFTSRKIEEDLKRTEIKPPIVNQQCVVYHFQCDPCDTGYVGYTCRHLWQRTEEHRNSSIGNHYKEIKKHCLIKKDLTEQFRVLKKCKSKFDCLINEMLFIRELKPSLNVQSDSIRAKLFT